MLRLVIAFCLFLYVQFYVRPVDAGGGYTSLSHSLDYTKMFCNGKLPKKKFGLITMDWRPSDPQWSYKNFTSLADLCSVHGNPKGNMGGMVRESYFSGILLLNTDIASPVHPVRSDVVRSYQGSISSFERCDIEASL